MTRATPDVALHKRVVRTTVCVREYGEKKKRTLFHARPLFRTS